MVVPDTTDPAFQRHDDENGIDIGAVTVRSHSDSIASSATEEAMSAELAIKLPSMLFDRNLVRLDFYPTTAARAADSSNAPPLSLTFCTADALRLVGAADPRIKVKAAERWAAKKERAGVELTPLEHPSDWTFSTRYVGTLSPPIPEPPGRDADAGADAQAGGAHLQQIDYDALRDTTLPILFSAQNVLFEDELDDNGTAVFRVRVRVMPRFVFVLARFFLRVDSVLVRVYDTRYFHFFGSRVLVRECVEREAAMDHPALSSLHASILRDADMLAPHVPIVASSVQNIALPSR